MDKRRADLVRAIDKFLADVEDEPKGDGDGWAPVTDDDIALLHRVVEELMKAKWVPDADGDMPVQVDIVDRTRCWAQHYQPVPYPHKSGVFDVLWPTITNANIALDSLEYALHMLRRHLTPGVVEQLSLLEDEDG